MRARDLLESKGPWIAFAATVSLTALLYFEGVQGHAVGFAESAVTSVSVGEVGRIVRLAAQVGQEVEAGEVLVELDPSVLDAEIDVLEAEEQRLLAGAGLDLVEARGREARAVADLEHELGRQREELASAQAELGALLGERRRLDGLVGDGLATREELRGLAVREAALGPLAREKPRRIALLEAQLAAARDRLVETKGARAGDDLGVVRRQLEERREVRATLLVRAPISGRVGAVLKRPGEVALAGEPIVTLVAPSPRVTLCLPESLALRVSIGDRALLVPRDAPSRSGRAGTVVSLAPLVDLFPERCRRRADVLEWGRIAVVEVAGAADLIAGQAFDVSFSEAGGGGDAQAATRPREDGAARPVEIPAALRRATRLEPSDLVWLPGIARFLVVSDDTGYPDRDDHAPWLFTMDERGAFDAQPLVLEGVDQVNDLEAVAAGPDGAVYLMSAQSHSRKGRRPAARTLFLKVVVDGRQARVAASVQLAPLLEAQGDAFLAGLGLPAGTRELEIEGLAVRDGAAYLGLKSPLDEQGRAIVWRLADVERFFATGALAPGQLTSWARLPLLADVDGRPVAGGVSSLLFAPDGKLRVASTPSRAQGGTEGGRLWRVADATTAELVRAFPALKPEGLALSGDGRALVIVFDRGAETPMWLSLPGSW